MVIKTILKIVTLQLTLIIICQCKKEVEPRVTIPDDNFLKALIEQGVDTNGNGIISFSEAEVITFLDVSEDSISDMTGIEAFINLDTLVCYDNQLTTLNVSKNTALKSLNCAYDRLITLDISNNTYLTDLNCYLNGLTTLDVSNNPLLEVLDCCFNKLTTLDFSNNPRLTYLDCGCFTNHIATLNFSNNPLLETLICQAIQLTNLNMTNNTLLVTLECGGNQLTILDVSKNTALINFGIGDMPLLTKVCVWQIPFPPTGIVVNTTGSPNVYFTTDCSK